MLELVDSPFYPFPQRREGRDGGAALLMHGRGPISAATNRYEMDSVYKTTSAPPSPPSPKG
jgi:hypothetical protein